MTYTITTYRGSYVANSYLDAKCYIEANLAYVPVNDNAANPYKRMEEVQP